MGLLRRLFVYFCLFKQTLEFLQQIQVKNINPVYSAGIQTHNFQNVSLVPKSLDQGYHRICYKFMYSITQLKYSHTVAPHLCMQHSMALSYFRHMPCRYRQRANKKEKIRFTFEIKVSNGPFPSPFVFIFAFSMLDSNRRPLALEATALPTEPQPLPFDIKVSSIAKCCYRYSSCCHKKWAYSCLFSFYMCTFLTKGRQPIK